MLQRKVHVFGRAVLVALGLAVALCGCSAGAIVDKLPGDMGEPADTPARPVTPYVYPAVHDMPAPRATPPMTEEQQVQMEKDLTATRDSQETAIKATEAAEAAEAAAAAKKNDAASAKDGAKTNP